MTGRAAPCDHHQVGGAALSERVTGNLPGRSSVVVADGVYDSLRGRRAVTAIGFPST